MQYKTSDLYLAAFLAAVGHRLLDVTPNARKRLFVFIDRPELHDAVNGYTDGSSTVSARDFASSIKSLKSRLYQ